MWLGEENIYMNVSYKEWQTDILNNPNRMRKKKPNMFYAKQRIQINKLKLAWKDGPYQDLCLTDTTS